MLNDISITVENVKRRPTRMDDEWDPMREDFENIQTNCYNHGPGVYLDASMQRPAYRDANNQIVFKIMVNRIPHGMSRSGLLNLLRNFGEPSISKCQEDHGNLKWALVEFKTLKEAEESIRKLHGAAPYGMRLSFARSDEENERLKREKEENERIYRQLTAKPANQIEPEPSQSHQQCRSDLLRMLGRGRGHRGRYIINAFRQHCDKRAGLKNCAWSSGIPDFRDPGGLIYDPKSNKYDLYNKSRQNININITADGNSVRRVMMGRGYIPLDGHLGGIPSNSAQNGQINLQKSFGSDVCVPELPCKKCSVSTIDKCSQCGTPYCSRKCQKEDYMRHKPECTLKECIDFAGNDGSLGFVPLSRPLELVQPSPPTPPPNQTKRNWARPSVVSMLREGTEAIVTINSEHPGQYHGVLSSRELFEVAENVFNNLALSVEQTPRDPSFWPLPGTSVAVKSEGTVWRGNILNSPIIGDSTIFTVALCDLAKIQKIGISDILPLSSDYFDVPEMAVTCDVIQSAPQLKSLVDKDKSVSLKVQSLSDSKASAQVVTVDGEVIGLVTISQWEPLIERALNPVHFTPPCYVTLSAYHHQHALYVRPVGRAYQEQMFNILQKVAAVMVTSPPLDRPPIRDEMVACRYSHDENYYRAMVHDAISDTEYSVFFVDFGNQASVPLTDMKALPWDLKTSPCMAVKVALKGVTHGPLTDVAIVWLDNVVRKELQLRLECSKHIAEGVELFLPDNRSFNTILQGLLLPEWKHLMNDGKDPHEVIMLDKVKVLPLIKDGSKNVTTTVMVITVMVDGRLAVCPMDQPEIAHVVETLNSQINEYCESTDPNMSYNPRENEVCLAKFNDGMWYRAVNTRTMAETQSCQVLFLDFGNVEDVKFHAVRRIVSDFTSPPTIMSMCHLDGVPDAPNKEMIQRIGQIVPTNKLLEVNVLDNIGFGEYKINIPDISDQLRSEFSSKVGYFSS